MKHLPVHSTGVLSAILLLVALVASASAGSLFGHSTAGAALAASLAVLVAAGAIATAMVGQRRDREQLERHLSALAKMPPGALADDSGNQAPPLDCKGPWTKVAPEVREALVEHGRRIVELEHAKTALELKARRAAAESQRVAAILANLPDPVLVVNEFDEIVLANPAAERLFQFELASTEDRAALRLLHCEKLLELLLGTSHRRSTGSQSVEFDLADAAGEPQSFRAHAARLPAEDRGRAAPAAAGAVAVLKDIGGQRALQKRNAEFVSSVSHEMKTPLAGIKAYVELLADGDAEDEATREEFLQVIQSQADRLQRLVDNLLNLARIEAGVVHVRKQSRPLNEVLEEAVHVVQPAAEAKQITLSAELSPLYLGVLADRDLLLQAAINLLSNAVKYTPAQGRVTLRSRLADREIVFEVEDTGVGLSEEDCRRVFEKFYRVESNKAMASGTGLGLPLAKHIVEDVHGGRLGVESRLGVGSRFIVTLPLASQTAPLKEENR